tara:strand:+ start:21839 stop:22687 length:849 start_codon:yes stop_codon:yes gene_type:complete
MSKMHNKKRNVGIIYELLLRSVSNFLIEGKIKTAQCALDILDKRFSPETELYREFRLFNALANSTVSDTSIAAAILSEAKSASRRYNIKTLNEEKSLLIRDINHKLKDEDFYHRRVPEYKSYATIQTLLNEWRKNDHSSLIKMVEYESKIVERLLAEKKEENIENHLSENVDELISKLMMEKLNNRYGDSLSKEQKTIVRSYVFSSSSGDMQKTAKLLREISEKTVLDLNNLENETDNEILLEKIERVKININGLDYEKINDNTISKFLTISQLGKEIMESK